MTARIVRSTPNMLVNRPVSSVKIRIVRLLAIAAAVWLSCDALADTRGVRPLSNKGEAPEAFDPEQSAALFVGVRRFPYDTTLADVRYAVDDAVDLAFSRIAGAGE